MAGVTDPSFGADDFPADEFRQAMINIGQMASPNKVTEKATFLWPDERTSSSADPIGVPYDFSEAPESSEEPKRVTLDVAVARTQPAPEVTNMGQFDLHKATIDLVDVQYELVRGATRVRLSDSTYVIEATTVQGLFDVDMYTLHCRAVDQR